MDVRLVENARLDPDVPLTKRDAIREFEVAKSPTHNPRPTHRIIRTRLKLSDQLQV
jgi:hypothetical protein